MKPTHIEHIGIAVKSLEESIPIFETLLGVKCKDIETIADQYVRTAIFEVGINKIELLETTDSEGPIGSFISKNGEGIHHIAFAVDDTNIMLEEVKQNGFKLIDRNARKGAENLNIGFLNPKSTNRVLIEFCSKQIE
jgi:methylmalonyl-CoA/ethylmalonyl-CoA epimerase